MVAGSAVETVEPTQVEDRARTIETVVVAVRARTARLAVATRVATGTGET